MLIRLDPCEFLGLKFNVPILVGRETCASPSGRGYLTLARLTLNLLKTFNVLFSQPRLVRNP